MSIYLTAQYSNSDSPKYPPELRADIAADKCRICERLFGEHSEKELESCFKQMAFCEICKKEYRDHSDEELDVCFTQIYNSRKYPDLKFGSWKRSAIPQED